MTAVGTSRVRDHGRHVDIAGRRADPEPGAHRVRLLGVRPGAGAVRRPDRDRRGGHQVGAAAARARAGRPRGWPRRPAACSTRSACRARASTGCSPTTCPGWPSGAPGRSSRSPAPASRTSPSWPTRLRGVPGVLGARGQHQLPERREPRRGVRLRPGGRLRRRRRRAGRRRPGPAGLRQAQPRRHRHRERRPGRHRRRRRRAVDDQHPARAGDRPRHDAPGARRGDRRAVRARRSGRWRCAASGRCTPALPGGADPGHGRHPTGLDALQFVLAGASRGLGRDGGLQRPVRASPGSTPSWPTALARARASPRWPTPSGTRTDDRAVRRTPRRRRRRPRTAVRGHRPARAAAGEVGAVRRPRRPRPVHRRGGRRARRHRSPS